MPFIWRSTFKEPLIDPVYRFVNIDAHIEKIFSLVVKIFESVNFDAQLSKSHGLFHPTNDGFT